MFFLAFFPALKQRLHQTDESEKLQRTNSSVPHSVGVGNCYQFQADPQLTCVPGACILVIRNGPVGFKPLTTTAKRGASFLVIWACTSNREKPSAGMQVTAFGPLPQGHFASITLTSFLFPSCSYFPGVQALKEHRAALSSLGSRPSSTTHQLCSLNTEPGLSRLMEWTRGSVVSRTRSSNPQSP